MRQSSHAGVLRPSKTFKQDLLGPAGLGMALDDVCDRAENGIDLDEYAEMQATHHSQKEAITLSAYLELYGLLTYRLYDKHSSCSFCEVDEQKGVISIKRLGVPAVGLAVGIEGGLVLTREETYDRVTSMKTLRGMTFVSRGVLLG
jgi:hypothetical protein